jgi:hypothetical protein
MVTRRCTVTANCITTNITSKCRLEYRILFLSYDCLQSDTIYNAPFFSCPTLLRRIQVFYVTVDQVNYQRSNSIQLHFQVSPDSPY